MFPSQVVCALKAILLLGYVGRLGLGGWELIKHLQKWLNYWDVFPLKFFLLDDLVYFSLCA